jgi:hypothetical protein
MRRRKGGAGGADERRLAELLRSAAEAHEPDLDAVRRRASAGSRSVASPPTTRQRWASAWAAAGFVVALAAGSLAVAGATDVLVADGHTDPVRAVPAGPAPPPGASRTTADRAPPPSSAPTTGAAAATSAPAPGRLTVRGAAPGQAVDLTDARAADWVVAGGRPDGTGVRRRAGGQVLGGPHVVGDPRARVSPGPFRVSWSGGMPAATGSRVGTWLTVHGRAGGPRTGYVVSAPVRGSLLRLYVGAGGPRARVTVELDGRERHVAALPAAPGGGVAGHVVTVRLDGSNATQVVVRVDAAGGGVVALAAAVLR